eukprot:TRINITY_DN38573_c0_g1_i1.p1 TRINITY_DN38573_c0_g1~~TRINITY_DN38573_c0_g1_i1.p1  ORF type:complete len:164 (+),score=50.12 TRINITY_DN38573_c0_g1_i1:59-493(+)
MGAMTEEKDEKPPAMYSSKKKTEKKNKKNRYVHKVDPSRRLPPTEPPKIPVAAWLVLVVMLLTLLFIILADVGAPPFDKDTSDEIPVLGKGVAPAIIGLVTLCYFSILMRRCIDHREFVKNQNAKDEEQGHENPLQPTATSYGT